jgi:hypothetical protein
VQAVLKILNNHCGHVLFRGEAVSGTIDGIVSRRRTLTSRQKPPFAMTGRQLTRENMQYLKHQNNRFEDVNPAG